MKKARENHRSYGVEVRADGSFRLDNIPAAEYTLMITVMDPGANHFPEDP